VSGKSVNQDLRIASGFPVIRPPKREQLGPLSCSMPVYRELKCEATKNVFSGITTRSLTYSYGRFGYADALRFASATLDARTSTLLISGAFAKRSGALAINAAATLPER
jgi:hypothetical protein